MYRKRITSIIAAAAACSLLIGNICFAADGASEKNSLTAQDRLSTEKKENAEYTSAENIYAVLASDGSFENAYVINSFDVKKAGTVTCYGDYDFLKNLTTLDGIRDENGAQIFSAEEGKFYYQGNSKEVKLPWKVSIEYFLDGKKVSAEELAGESGALEIVMKTEKEPSVNPVFYENYMLQATFTLNMEKCSNIEAEDAAVAEAGSNKTVIFTVLPGKDSEMHLKADVKDFEMDAASIAAVPFSMAIEMPDVDEMADGLTQLTDAIAQLDQGVGELVNGMDTLTSNTGTLKGGMDTFAQGINTVSANSGTLVNASAQVQGALQMIADRIGSVDMSSMEQLAKLPEALYSLADALAEVQNGLAGAPGAFDQAYGELSNAVNNLSGAVLTSDELAALQAAVDASGNADAQIALEKAKSLNDLLQQLPQVEVNAEQVKQMVQYLTEIVGQLEAGIRQKAQELEAQNIAGSMTALQSGLGELAANYTTFHSGLTAYTQGVDALAAGYGELNQGVNAYLSGVDLAASGTKQLKEGTSLLALNTENIPEEMQKQIDELMAEYEFDFTPVSFMDERNKSVTSVQFIISTPKIAVPEPEEEIVEEEEKGIIDRLKALF